MKTAQDYRNHADECRALARKARTEEERLQLLTMASTWDGLAAEREQQLGDTTEAATESRARPTTPN